MVETHISTASGDVLMNLEQMLEFGRRRRAGDVASIQNTASVNSLGHSRVNEVIRAAVDPSSKTLMVAIVDPPTDASVVAALRQRDRLASLEVTLVYLLNAFPHQAQYIGFKAFVTARDVFDAWLGKVAFTRCWKPQDIVSLLGEYGVEKDPQWVRYVCAMHQPKP